MGINIRNNIRKVNAKLVNATIDKYGASYPAQSPWRADGFNKVFVEIESANPTQKDFLEGNSSVYVYAIGSNIGSLLPYSLASFTNIKELYLFSPTMVNIGAINDDYLTYLTDSDLKVYVPSDILQNYINAYGGTGKHLENRFDEITYDYPLTVSGSGNLTSKELTNQLMNNYEQVDRTNCTKLVIQGFTNVSSILWGYDFSEILPNLNNNIWFESTKLDFTTRELSGVDELLESDITNLINGISSDKINGVTQLKFSGFSDMSVALGYDYEDLPNLEYIWLDNVRYNIDDLIVGYIRVEYLQGNGSAYIDSGTNFNLTDSIKFSSTRIVGDSGALGSLLIGVYSGSLTSQFMAGYSQTNDFYINIVNVSGAIQGNKYTFEYKNDENNELYWYIDGDKKTTRVQTANTDLNYWIFARNFNGSANSPCVDRIYFIEHKNINGEYVRNFIPVLKNGEYFLYDLANKVEYHKTGGTGAFAGGNIYYPATYFYPISDLVSEYDSTKEQTFYLDYNGTLPTYPNYQLTYYTDINCTTSILPENMQSGTRYYVKAVYVGE